jgi:hypothetical protein
VLELEASEEALSSLDAVEEAEGDELRLVSSDDDVLLCSEESEASILGLKKSMNISTTMAHAATTPMAIPVTLRRIVSPGVRRQVLHCRLLEYEYY